MMETLYIKWDTGYMNINTDVFFPCNMGKFKKLQKVIELDWEHREELTEKLKLFFQKQILICKAAQKESANKYVDAMQQRNDAERKIKSRKQANGVPLSKSEIEQEKLKLQFYKKEVANSLSAFKKNKRAVEQYTRLLGMIEQ